eukprot:scaffold2141_cov223-Skeletonema_dohrnii-CCMP3373.AAC.3
MGGHDHGMVLPDNVGFPLFDSGRNQAILIEMHYNNPKKTSGIQDFSGVRFHYTSTPRKYDAGIIQLGDPFLGLRGVKINDGFTQHDFTCDGKCSSTFLDEPVTVIMERLHMHKTGTRMVNEVVRGGAFQPQQDSYQLQAGDKFRTTCYYKDGTVFEEGSQDEMCIGYMFYYPAAKTIAGFPFVCPYPGDYPGQIPCEAKYKSTDLSDYDGLGRIFGAPGETQETTATSTTEATTTSTTTEATTTTEYTTTTPSKTTEATTTTTTTAARATTTASPYLCTGTTSGKIFKIVITPTSSNSSLELLKLHNEEKDEYKLVTTFPAGDDELEELEVGVKYVKKLCVVPGAYKFVITKSEGACYKGFLKGKKIFGDCDDGEYEFEF